MLSPSLFFKSFLFIGITSFILSCSNAKSGGSSNLKFAYVNVDEVTQNYDKLKDIKKKLEDKTKAAQADLQAKGMAFQKEVIAYQQNAQKMTNEQRMVTEQKLGQKQKELQAYSQTISENVLQEERQENEKLYQMITDVVSKYAKENGYQAVFTSTKLNSPVLYAEPTMDISKDILKLLNEKK